MTGDGGNQTRSIQYVDDLVDGGLQLRRSPGWAPTVDLVNGPHQTIEWALEFLSRAANPGAISAGTR